MPKIRAVFVVILLLLVGLPLLPDFDSDIISNTIELENKVDPNKIPREQSLGTIRSARSTRATSKFVENNSHGGTWRDSFKDQAEIDLGQSVNVLVYDGNAKINLTHYYDPYTVARWHFEESSGTTVYDETNYNNDGTIYGGATRVSGKFGKCLSFDGTDDRVDVSDSPSLSITGQITISAWLNFSSLPSSGRNYCIVKKRIGTSDSYQMFIRDTGKVRWMIDTGPGTISITTNTVLNDNNWHFIAGTWDQSNLKLYLDGVNDATAISLSGSMKDTSDKLAMGYHSNCVNPSSWNYYNGLMDDVWISKIVRSAREIKNIYENGTLNNFRIANLHSKPITIPTGMQWDSIIINKSHANNQYLNITILNATTNQQIPGTPKFINDGEFDISYIDPSVYPTIKLKAYFEGNSSSTPLLHYWGVSWNSNNSWRDSFFGGLKSIILNQTFGDGELWLTPDITQWIKYSNNPILSFGAGSSWDNGGVATPNVVYNDTGYMMWYRGYMNSSTWRIGLATSPDGITWTKYSGNPVLKQGSTGSWDERNVGKPSVLYDGKTYKMWHQGQDTTMFRQIGYATSTDGINWQRHPSNPVIPNGGANEWDEYYACIPNVYFDGIIYKNWYTGVANKPYDRPYQIGYATSYDGINWTKYSKNPIISGPKKAMNGVPNLFVIPEIENGRYLGWHNYVDGINRWLNLTTSMDGISWTEYANNPILSKGSPGSWDDYLTVSASVLKIGHQYYMYYVGSDGSKNQIGLAKSKFNTTGVLTSEKITLPLKCYYDKLIINKTEATGAYLNVSIIDATTQQKIKSFENIRNKNVDVFDISPFDHPSIILKASFDSNGYETPILFDWSLNWTRNAPPRIIDINSSLIVNRTFSIPIRINLSDREEPEEKLTLNLEYQSPTSPDWESDYLSAAAYTNGYFEYDFSPPAEAELGLYNFKFRCNDSFQEFFEYPDPYYILVRNNYPIIWNISLNPYDKIVNRTHTREILINTYDVEIPTNELIIDIEYRPLLDGTWIHIPNKDFKNGLWEADFAPSKFMDTGICLFNITCNDTDTEVYKEFYLQVRNNLPTAPEVSISPFEPKTLDDLIVEAKNAFDVETPQGNLKYWYRWDKDNFYMQEFENITIIPHSATVKGDNWRCVVFIHDGDELGPPGVAETKILNSPPELVEQFNSYEMFEDIPAILKNKLKIIFTDADEDKLIFATTATEQYNITVEILQDNGTVIFTPRENWFGTQAITFYANDSSPVQAEETVIVTVKPMNDLPVITQVGSQYTYGEYKELEFFVNQDEWLNLSIIVKDIDGDVARGLISYFLNITDSKNLYFSEGEKKIAFHPLNEHVGWHYINITITDNNETPLEYISQHIRIRVRNINDPPTVQILTPTNNQVFVENQLIIFNCTAEDIDFLAWNSGEELTYKWSWAATDNELGTFGFEQWFTNKSLKPGTYNITVEVRDSSGETSYDTVTIVVKKVPDEDGGQFFASFQLWQWLVIIIILIIIIVSIIFMIYTRKKKRERDAVAAAVTTTGPVLQPDAAYLPSTGLAPRLDIVKSPQLSQPQIIQGEPLASAPAQQILAPSPTVSSEPRPQLPPSQPMIAAPEQPVETGKYETKLSIQDKLELLEERLLRGEIDQELFESLKAKYEMDIREVQLAPQLPPATSTPTPTPAPAAQVPITTSPAQTIPPTQVPTQKTTLPQQPQIQSQVVPQVQPQVQTQPQPSPQHHLPKKLQ